MNHDMSVIGLFLQAGFVVQGIMLCLLLVSIVSWAVIVKRQQMLSRAKRECERFEDEFWSGLDLNNLYNDIISRESIQGLESIFSAGFKEYVRLRQKGVTNPQSLTDASARSMRVALSREIDVLEQQLPFLASAGSVSPYVGLFGTVWGIMNAFIALGDVKQATLTMVAPGIAEALIATAIGLFAAIPAVVAYNRFSHKVEKLEASYVNFAEEFTAILHRQSSVG